MAKGTTGRMTLTVNDLEVSWDENSRRSAKPCSKCGKPTQGRATNGGGITTPSCVSCAVAVTIDKALKVYGTKAAA